MSSSRTSTPRGANAKVSYVRATPERVLEKKVASAQRAGATMTEKHVVDLTTSLPDKVLGKGALALHIGQDDGITRQLVIHRPIGTDPKATESDWALSTKAQISGFLEVKGNPYHQKTQEAVSKIKLTAALEAGVLIENADGLIAYPGGELREDGLKKAGELANMHGKIQGCTKLAPTFVYATPTVQEGERNFLNFCADDPEVQKELATATKQHDAHVTKDPATGAVQAMPPYLKGVPPKHLLEVVLDVIRTGSYDAATWDPIKVTPKTKDSPFTVWKYSAGNIPQDKMVKLKDEIFKHAKLVKELNALIPRGKEAVAAETKEQLAARRAKEAEVSSAVHDVNEAEKFKKELPVASPPTPMI